MEPKRREITGVEAQAIPSTPDSITFVTGNGSETIRVGDYFPSRARGRFVLRVRGSGPSAEVVYYESGKVYVHQALYFWKESWMEAFQTGAHWARGSMIVAQMQVELCMGIMAGAGGPVAHWALTATDVIHLFSEVDVIELIRNVPKLLRARRMLKEAAPLLYDKLFSGFVDKMLEGAGQSLMSAATAHFVGRVLGRLGRHVPGQLLKTIKDIAMWAATFVGIRIVAMAGLAASDLKRLGLQMRDELKKLNIHLSDAESEAIVRQIFAHKVEVLKAMQLMMGGDVTDSPSAPGKKDDWLPRRGPGRF
ncbi:MAG: hypothetical protein IANPNBLG_00185 [Bryobacteraceae bacterium]|nr:hypothetical protein [Bryobacteraceae bacterium]